MKILLLLLVQWKKRSEEKKWKMAFENSFKKGFSNEELYKPLMFWVKLQAVNSLDHHRQCVLVQDQIEGLFY